MNTKEAAFHFHLHKEGNLDSSATLRVISHTTKTSLWIIFFEVKIEERDKHELLTENTSHFDINANKKSCYEQFAELQLHL